MKSIYVQLKDKKYEKYFFVLYINQLNILHSFIVYKLDNDIMDYVLYDINNFSDEDIEEITKQFYHPDNFNVFNDLHPYQILINRSKKDRIDRNYQYFKQSSIFHNDTRYSLLFTGEVFHELFFLIHDKEIDESILVLTESVNGFKVIKDTTFINDLPIEEVALILSLLVPRVKEKDMNFVIHLSETIEIMLYREDNHGYAFVVNKEKLLTDDKAYSVRFLFFDIMNSDKSQVLYQTEFNQPIISKLRKNAKEILLKSKYYELITRK